MNIPEPTIIVVDPDTDRAIALASSLDRRGYRAVRRSSGIDALKCVAEYRPDLVLSEVNLLDFDSPELLRAIREISPSTQVLFIARQRRCPHFPEDMERNLLRTDVAAGVTDEVVQAADRLLERKRLQEFPCQA